MNVAHCVQDFKAHGDDVTSLALGHKSGHVLVTGGDDKKVNLWAVGKQDCIISLSGHVSPIECVRFGPTENTVCAGSVAGILKVWDLEVCRLMRTLTGHKNAVSCVEFHPYGDFLASGSKDTSIKLWDVRRKGCISTYHGHGEAVNSLKFSPDGQWIASAGNDGVVKLWDLRMGRVLRDFNDQGGPVRSVEFHPHEFLLASASQDNRVNFWDLENFSLVSSIRREPSPSRCLLFSNNGEVLFAGATDLLRVYGWEPSRTISVKSVSWGAVRDVALSHDDDKLIAASYHSTYVTIWVIDTSELAGTGEMNLNSEVTRDSPTAGGSQFNHGNSLRKSFSKQRPLNEDKKQLNVKTIEESERSETDPEDDIQPEIHNVKDYQAIFQPSRSLNRSPTISIYARSRPERVSPTLPSMSSPFASALHDVPVFRPKETSLMDALNESPLAVPVAPSHPLMTPQLPTTLQDISGSMSKETSIDTLSESPPTNRTFTLSHSTACLHVSEEEFHETPDIDKTKPGSTSTPTSYENHPNMTNVLMNRRQSMSSPPLTSTPALANFHPRLPSTLPPSPVSTRTNQRRHSTVREPNTALYQPHSSHLDNEFPVKLSSIHHSSSESNVPGAASIERQRLSTRHRRTGSQASSLHKPTLRETMSAELPGGLDFDEPTVLPESNHNIMALSPPMPDMSEAEVLSSMMRGHETVSAILESRNRNLKIIYMLWQSRGLKAGIDRAVNIGGNAVMVDILNIITKKPASWNLDICVAALPAIFELLQSRYETYMRAGCDALRLILRHFSSVIKSNVLSGSVGLGVDIPREERYQKCLKCYNVLVSIRTFLLTRQTLQGPLGQSFRELHVYLRDIDD